MVHARRGLDPEPAAGEPEAEREVDILVVEEELGREPTGLEVRGALEREAGAGDEARIVERDRLARGQLVQWRPGVAGPGDAGEVDDPAPGVHRPPAVGRDQRLPRRPAPPVDQRALDRVAPRGIRDRIRIEQHQEIPARRLGTAVTGLGEAEIGAGLDHRRRRGELADQRRRPVLGGVVDDDQLVAVAELGDQRRQRRAHRFSGVVRDGDDREAWHGRGT